MGSACSKEVVFRGKYVKFQSWSEKDGFSGLKTAALNYTPKNHLFGSSFAIPSVILCGRQALGIKRKVTALAERAYLNPRVQTRVIL